MNIGSNIKKLREARHLTQEQLGKILKISFQAISKWENSITLPDTSILPELARALDVLIDDLFKDEVKTYSNYASRLFAIYESSNTQSDFIMADEEYRKLVESENYTSNDLRLYGRLYDRHMYYCRDKALELYERVLERDKSEKGETYYITARYRIILLIRIGRVDQAIKECVDAIENEPDVAENYSLLLVAYESTGEHEKGLVMAQTTISKFPNNALAYGFAGDFCKSLKRYDEAFKYWNQSLELSNQWCDVMYSKVFCYQELGMKKEELEQWKEIVSWLEERGGKIEAEEAKQRIRILEKELQL